jgi:hypothetical protein
MCNANSPRGLVPDALTARARLASKLGIAERTRLDLSHSFQQHRRST